MILQVNSKSIPKKMIFQFSSQSEEPKEPNENDDLSNFEQRNQKQQQKRSKSAYCSLLIATINFAMLGYYNNLSPEEKEVFLECLSLSKQNIFEKGQIYNLLTYGFVNTTDYQWLMGSLVLGTVGAGLEISFGSKLFLKYYLGGILFGGLMILGKQMMNNTSYEQRGPITGQLSLLGAVTRFYCVPIYQLSLMYFPQLVILAILPPGIFGLLTYLLHQEENGEIDLDVKFGCLGLGFFYSSTPFSL